MNGNSFGKLFRITTWGESHGPSMGVVIDGCPSGLPLCAEDFIPDMQRRQGGQGSHSTPRQESDLVSIESGVYGGVTTGTPITILIKNENTQSKDYDAFRFRPRPGHADLTSYLKHEHRDHRGGGRSSARETVSRVAAGVVAKKLLARLGVDLIAWVEQMGPYQLPKEDIQDLSVKEIRALSENSPLRIPAKQQINDEWLQYVSQLRAAGDSWGGRVGCKVDGLPPALGEPIFDKLQATLAHGLMSLPAAIGFKVGYMQADAPGSAIRDPIGFQNDSPKPLSNSHGGLLGGISTGCPLALEVAFHAPTSIPRPIQTVDLQTKEEVEISVGGRHDAFPLPRAVPMVEAMVAITLIDAILCSGKLPEKL